MAFRSQQYLAATIAMGCLSLFALVYLIQNPALRGPILALTNSREDLREVKQVVFVKVHKAASSTVQNILMRFAMHRNLSILLPPTGVIINQASKTIENWKVMPHPEGRDKFDILCNHVVFDDNEISKYFPENAVRVAILREPMQQALSAMVYYATKYPTAKLKDAVKKYKEDPINGFLRHPNDFYVPNPKWGPMTSYINNRMGLDLGFDWSGLEESKNNMSKIENFVKRIDNEIDIVLISEYFDESMVLLRRYLRWSIEDIVYLKSNTATHLPTSSPYTRKPNITSKVAETFRQWAIIDYKLYEYFLSKFLKKIKHERHFNEEVAAFQAIQKLVKDFCFNGVNRTLQIVEDKWTKSFTVSKHDCEIMNMNEINLVDLVRNKQLERSRKFKQKLKPAILSPPAASKNIQKQNSQSKKRKY